MERYSLPVAAENLKSKEVAESLSRELRLSCGAQTSPIR